jgi:hypothetical protein
VWPIFSPPRRGGEKRGRGNSSVDAIFQSFVRVPADPMLVERNLNALVDRLKTRHHFLLTAEDERGIQALYRTFSREGVSNFISSFRSPGHATLMTLTDRAGKNWVILRRRTGTTAFARWSCRISLFRWSATFAGPKAIRAVGQYLTDHGSTVHVFYISNVEDYISAFPKYVGNIASLPTDPSSVLLRWNIGGYTSFNPISDNVRTQDRLRREATERTL